MKKIAIFFALMVFAITIVFATNTQKIHPVGSDVYEAITYLYISNGYALPSTAGPWSTNELLKLLDKVDRTKLSNAAQSVYDYAKGVLTAEPKLFKFGLEAALEANIHTDTENFTTRKRWVKNTNDRKSLLDIRLETNIANYFYGYSSFLFDGRRFNQFSPTEGHTSAYFGQEAFTTNLFFLYGSGIGDLDLGMPYRAFGALGGEGWSFQIGRDNLSWGAGETGNLMLGDHLRYHDLARLALYGKNFKYTLVTSFFAHPDQYYPILDGSKFTEHDQRTPLYGLNMFLGHRLEWRMFKDKVGFSVSEAIMFQTAKDGTEPFDSVLDPRILNPSMLFHNLYIRSNANSLLTFELDYSPIKYLNIYGQMAIDEFYLPGESQPGVANSAFPTALGYIAGVKTGVPVRRGVAYGSLEFALTDPFLYLRDNNPKGEDQAIGDYGINFIVAHREYSGPKIKHGVTYYEEFLGYKYGPDAIVINANGGYKEFGKWYAEGNIFYMLHGTHDEWTLWSNVYKNANWEANKPPILTTPTDKHWTENQVDPAAHDNRDAVSQTFVIGVKGGYTFLKGFDVYGQFDFINIVNPGNIASNAPIRDFQFSVGLSYSL
ncbi:MAG: hypothetical protein WC224_04255 [Sphaerochaetaceae bacterium]